ncbi:MAG TPA: two-component regulator propeller domain-containing protein, partial [Kofleriaceae bacterium]
MALWSQTALADDIAARDDLPPGQLTFRVFAGADGLRNLVINSIAQDGNGLLWVATDDGAYRFDGQRFTQFSVADGLIANRVLVAGVGPDGEACLGGLGGLVCWDGARFSQAHTAGLPALAVHAMVSFGGKLWVATDGGLYVREPGGAFAPAPGWRGTRDVRVLWADALELIVGDDATVQLTSGDGAWRRLDHVGIANDPTNVVDGVLRDREGALWIRTPSHLWLLARGATRAVDVREGLPSAFVRAGVPTGMVIGPRGNVLLGTDIGIASRENGLWRILDRTVGVSAASNRTLFVDHEGSLWIGTAGLAQLRGRGLIESYGAASGMAGDDVWTFRRDPQGTLWAGTNRCLARARAGRWECLPGSENRTVRTALFPPQGGVFIGGLPSDLLYIDRDGHATSLGSGG